jgi:hypothetical protein
MTVVLKPFQGDVEQGNSRMTTAHKKKVAPPSTAGFRNSGSF